jgi:hypothetical protein
MAAHVFVLLALAFLGRGEAVGQIPKASVKIPTPARIAELAPDEKAAIETIFNSSVEDALRLGYIQPGQILDFSQPAIRFVYYFQRWVSRRIELTRKFGPQIHALSQDVDEIERWNAAEDAWESLRKEIDRTRAK